jgi:DNA polymerase I-like protein with 3'-5' exonuclease and polymerase domains
LHAVTAQLRKTIPDDISLDDRTSVKEYLNSKYGLSLAKIDEEADGTISDAAATDLIRHLLDYWKTSRELRQVEFYMGLTDPEGRVRDSIDQLNTKTGRFYRQLQTVEKDGVMRSLFMAKEGYKFVVADYSQQEARIIAGLSGDQSAIDLFKAGKDIYLETAKLLVGNRADGPPYRDLGKEIVLGLNNGRSAYSICESLARMGFGYDVDDIQGMILRYGMKFPGIQAWRDTVVKSARDNGVIGTGLGRTLKVSDDVNENSLYNYPVQGTAADGFKRALLELDDQLAVLDARIVHILHDEVIVEAKDDIVDAVTEIVKKCMEGAFKETLPLVPFVVEPVVKEGWG